MKKILLSTTCFAMAVPALTVTACTYIDTVEMSIVNKVKSVMDSTSAAFTSSILANSEGYNSDIIDGYVTGQTANKVTNMNSDQAYSAIKNSLLDEDKFNNWRSELKQSDPDYQGKVVEKDETKEMIKILANGLTAALGDGFNNAKADIITSLLSNMVGDGELFKVQNVLGQIEGFSGIINTLSKILKFAPQIFKMLDVTNWPTPDFSMIQKNQDLINYAQIEIVNLFKALTGETETEFLSLERYKELKPGLGDEQKPGDIGYIAFGLSNALKNLGNISWDWKSIDVLVDYIPKILLSISTYISLFDSYQLTDEEIEDADHTLAKDKTNYKIICEVNEDTFKTDQKVSYEIKSILSLITNLFTLKKGKENYNKFRINKILFTFSKKTKDFDIFEDLLKIEAKKGNGFLPSLYLYHGNFSKRIIESSNFGFNALFYSISDILLKNFIGDIEEQIEELKDKDFGSGFTLNKLFKTFELKPSAIIPGIILNLLANNDFESLIRSINVDGIVNKLFEMLDLGMLEGMLRNLINPFLEKQKDTIHKVESIVKIISPLMNSPLNNLLNGSKLDQLVFKEIKFLLPENIKSILGEEINSFSELLNMDLFKLLKIEEKGISIAQLITIIFESKSVSNFFENQQIQQILDSEELYGFLTNKVNILEKLQLHSINELLNSDITKLLNLFGINFQDFEIMKIKDFVKSFSTNIKIVISLLQKTLSIISNALISKDSKNSFFQDFDLKNQYDEPCFPRYADYDVKYDIELALLISKRSHAAIYAVRKGKTRNDLPERLDQNGIVSYILGNYEGKMRKDTIYKDIYDIFQGTTGNMFSAIIKSLKKIADEFVDSNNGLTTKEKQRSYSQYYSTQLIDWTNFKNKNQDSTISYKISYKTTKGHINTYVVKLKTNINKNVNNTKYEVASFVKQN
ncbi:hypothetical protein ELUMI_v1c03140 [Williamsoniiplasma luminosum]|uniref:MOLPALP family lipoprotein n=1 Tax=Williamsoniiplasma luminosum TaxID=214888 RepID=A0A2K8NTC7_9MOLU|nr:hypothetical protein [Williamsoniiplasma luminosum]ATZ17039.1 hypothetical protein ELUMI_v1c03140 [Williamsoniiplasma luminosum]